MNHRSNHVKKIFSSALALTLVMFFALLFSKAFSQETTSETSSEIRILVVKISETESKVTPVVDVTHEAQTFITTDPEGKQSIWQTSLPHKFVTAYKPSPKGYKLPFLNRIIQRYDEIIAEFPGSLTLLETHREKWVRDRDSFLEKFSGLAENPDAFIDKAISTPYDSAKSYTDTEINALIEKLEMLTELQPDRTLDITKYLTPFRIHLSHLKKGEKWFEGAWKTPQQIKSILEERERQAERERLQKIKESAIKLSSFEMEASVIPQQKTILILLAVIIPLSISICLTYRILVLPRYYRLKWFDWSFLLFILGTFGTLGYGGFYASQGGLSLEETELTATDPITEKIQEETSLPDSEISITPFERILYISNASDKDSAITRSPENLSVALNISELNQFITKNLTFSHRHAPDPVEIKRSGLQISLSPGQIRLTEELKLLGFSCLIHHKIPCIVTDTEITFGQPASFLGNLPLHSKFSAYLWNKLNQELSNCLDQKKLPSHYRLADIDTNLLTLKAQFKKPQTNVIGQSD